PALDAAPRGAALRIALDERGVETAPVSDAEFGSAAGTEAPQGILALAEIPVALLDTVVLPERARIVVLDGVQDPGNVGTILRTAVAFATAVTLSLPGTADVWNAKVVRSAAGALFHHPPISLTWPELDEFLRATGTIFWGADARGAPIEDLVAPARLALAVGNEGAGLSGEARARVAQTVGIAITGDAESLNVAVAAGILLHYLRA
ncbi:MAG: RNA methyltransferase, partial [Gemmatimonadota bacterium]|nr:RNA methyltransferase [Gemmatimonadota bacterium]